MIHKIIKATTNILFHVHSSATIKKKQKQSVFFYKFYFTLRKKTLIWCFHLRFRLNKYWTSSRATNISINRFSSQSHSLQPNNFIYLCFEETDKIKLEKTKICEFSFLQVRHLSVKEWKKKWLQKSFLSLLSFMFDHSPSIFK